LGRPGAPVRFGVNFRAIPLVARLAQRVTSVCQAVQPEIESVRYQAERTRQARAASFGYVFEVDDEGNETLINHKIQLSPVEQEGWIARERAVWEAQRPDVEAALVALDEEVAVLRMFAPGLAVLLGDVGAATDGREVAQGGVGPVVVVVVQPA
jgi:hypothetical protein